MILTLKLEVKNRTWIRLIEALGKEKVERYLVRRFTKDSGGDWPWACEYLADLMDKWPAWAFKPCSEPIDELQKNAFKG